MPHIVIKAIKGATPQQIKDTAEQIAEVVNKTMGKARKHISVSIEEYTFDEWEGVYNDCIKGKDMLIKPGYTNPKTFE